MKIGVQPDSVLRELADSATKGDTVRLGSFKKMNAQDMYEIYKAANHASGGTGGVRNDCFK